MVWIVASDKRTHSRVSSHRPMRCAKNLLYRIPCTHAQRVARKLSPSSSTKKRHRQDDDGHRTSASATEDVRGVGQRIFLARALLLNVPVRKLHATRWLCTTRFPGAPPSSSSSSPAAGLSSGGFSTKWRRADVVKPTAQHPDVSDHQEQR